MSAAVQRLSAMSLIGGVNRRPTQSRIRKSSSIENSKFNKNRGMQPSARLFLLILTPDQGLY